MSKIKEYISNTEQDTERIAKDFLDFINKKNVNVVGMIGDLGAGKTRFVKFIANELGVKETVNSPTFLIMKNYKITNINFSCLYHLDLYRISNIEETSNLGLEEIFKNQNNLVFIEWANKMYELLPKNHIKIFFLVIGESNRKIIIQS